MLILTSNVAAAQIHAIDERPGLDAKDRQDLVRVAAMDEIRRTFRPEFLNRLDETVIFNRLDRSQIRHIVDIQLRRFATRLERRNLVLEVSDRAKDFLAEAGWDPQYGARPLKRAIQRNLEDALARKVLAGEFPTGTTVVVDRAASGALTFQARMQN